MYYILLYIQLYKSTKIKQKILYAIKAILKFKNKLTK